MSYIIGYFRICPTQISSIDFPLWWLKIERFYSIRPLLQIFVVVFTNKVLLGHSHSHFLVYCLWLLSRYGGRVEELPQKRYGPQSLKYLLPGPLAKTSANSLFTLLHLLDAVLCKVVFCGYAPFVGIRPSFLSSIYNRFSFSCTICVYIIFQTDL